MDISNLKPPLNANRQKILIERAQAGDKVALETVAEHNMRLVVRIAANFCKRSGRDLETAIADGAAGLYGAIMRFDQSRGFAFSSFAYPTIENSMKWVPDPPTVPLDKPLGDDGDYTLQDTLADPGPGPEDEVNTTLLRAELERLMTVALSEREAKLVQNYYGWHDDVQRSFKMVGDLEGISANRARTLVQRAEYKLGRRYRQRRDEFMLGVQDS